MSIMHHEKWLSLFIAFVFVCVCEMSACVIYVHACAPAYLFVFVGACHTCGGDNIGLVFDFNIRDGGL